MSLTGTHLRTFARSSLMQAVCLLGMVPVPALAQGGPKVSAPVHVLPSTGLWWSAGQNGHFLQLAIGPGGYALATLTESDAQGQPTYRVLQGPFEASDVQAGDGLGRIASNFYRVVDSTCIECGPADGRTVDTGSFGALRFSDGTHAELLDRSGVVRRYELFPLLTEARQTTAERVTDQRYLLSAAAGNEPVRLRAVEPTPACESADLPQARNFRLEFERPASELAAVYADLRLQIAPGINPRLAMKIEVPIFERVCISPGSFFTCQTYEIRPSGRSRCTQAYTLFESGTTLRGAAARQAGAGLLYEFDGTYTPYTPARYSGALTLTQLPID